MRKRLKVFLFVPFILNKEIHFVKKFIFYLFWPLCTLFYYLFVSFFSYKLHIYLCNEFQDWLIPSLPWHGVRDEIKIFSSLSPILKPDKINLLLTLNKLKLETFEIEKILTMWRLATLWCSLCCLAVWRWRWQGISIAIYSRATISVRDSQSLFRPS